MNDARHDPDEQWIDVPAGEKPWGRTVRTWVDEGGKRHVQTNVPRPETVAVPGGTMFIAAADTLCVSGLKVDAGQIATSGLAHDCTPWTERTDRKIAALEDAVNRIADKLQYLLLRLEDGGK